MLEESSPIGISGHILTGETSSIKALVIKSTKPGVFIAGADIKEIMRIREQEDSKDMVTKGQHIFNQLMNMSPLQLK